MSLALNISGEGAVITANFNPPITLEGDYDLSLLALETFNVKKNVTEKNNCLHYGEGKEIRIAPGCYTITDLSEAIDNALCTENNLAYMGGEDDEGEQMCDLGHRAIAISGNNQTQTIQFICRFAIDFGQPNSIGPSLGFNATIYESVKKHSSTKRIGFLDYACIHVECDIIKGAYNNGVRHHTIHEAFLESSAGYKVVDYAKPVIYFPVVVQVIDKLQIRLCDQNGKLLDLADQISRVRLHLRPRKDYAGYL